MTSPRHRPDRLRPTEVSLPVALRAHMEPVTARKRRYQRRRQTARPEPPELVLVFDTETTIDLQQALLFGGYQICCRTPDGRLRCHEEGLIYGDDLPKRDPTGFARLQHYVRTHRARVVSGASAELHFMSRETFVEQVLRPYADQAPALIVAHNLPFDLSRLAVDVGRGRGRYRNGFSFSLQGDHHASTTDGYRARVAIRHIDRRRAFMRLTVPRPKTKRRNRPRRAS